MSHKKTDLTSWMSFLLPDFLASGNLKSHTPNGFIIYPQELTEGKPHRGERFYKGEFALESGVAKSGVSSPFELIPPHAEWKKELLGFTWLRDMKAQELVNKKSSNSRKNIGLSTIHARSLINDWIEKQTGEAAPETKARRLISWFYNAEFLLQNDDGLFQDHFLTSIGHQVRHLNKITPHHVPENQRLTCFIALCLAYICLDGVERSLSKTVDGFSKQIKKEILPDGGHISRNPQKLIDILLDFIPLLRAFEARSKPAPKELVNAIDRMFPMLKFFILGDGGLAQFNGTSKLNRSAIAKLLKKDSHDGKPLQHARHSGYHRIEKGSCVIVLDTGKSPPEHYNDMLHSSALSFEMSSDKYRLIVNCGGAKEHNQEWEEAAKATAAHTTLVIDDTSENTATPDALFSFNSKEIISDPDLIKDHQKHNDQGSLIEVGHEGYLDRFGIIHQRRLYVSSSGKDLRGEDCLVMAGPQKVAPRNFAIRFHLHPDVKVTMPKKGKQIHLLLPNKAAWSFVSSGAKTLIEDSIYLTGSDKPKKSRQIVLHGPVRDKKIIKWALKHTSNPKQKRRQKSNKSEPNLPFDDV